jgi:hypothetical protein
MLVTCTCNVPLVATHSRNQSNNSTSSETVDGMLRNFWGHGKIEEEKLPRKTELYTLIKSYSNTKLVQS